MSVVERARGKTRMTKEEAINRIKILKPMINPPTDKQVGWLETWIYKEDMEAIDMAVEALEKESRKGHWVEHIGEHSTYYECSKCGCLAPCSETATSFLWKLSNFCPDCGTEMIEPIESENE